MEGKYTGSWSAADGREGGTLRAVWVRLTGQNDQKLTPHVRQCACTDGGWPFGLTMFNVCINIL